MTPMAEFDQLRELYFLPIEARGFCWSVGRTRLGLECRIWPLAQNMTRPSIIETAKTLEAACQGAIARLGDRSPQPPEEKYRRIHHELGP